MCVASLSIHSTKIGRRQHIRRWTQSQLRTERSPLYPLQAIGYPESVPPAAPPLPPLPLLSILP